MTACAAVIGAVVRAEPGLDAPAVEADGWKTRRALLAAVAADWAKA